MAAFQVTCNFVKHPQDVISFVFAQNVKELSTKVVVDKALSTLTKNEVKELLDMIIDQKSGEAVPDLKKHVRFTKPTATGKDCYVNITQDDMFWYDYRDEYYKNKFANSFTCVFCFW